VQAAGGVSHGSALVGQFQADQAGVGGLAVMVVVVSGRSGARAELAVGAVVSGWADPVPAAVSWPAMMLACSCRDRRWSGVDVLGFEVPRITSF